MQFFPIYIYKIKSIFRLQAKYSIILSPPTHKKKSKKLCSQKKEMQKKATDHSNKTLNFQYFSRFSFIGGEFGDDFLNISRSDLGGHSVILHESLRPRLRPDDKKIQIYIV